MIISAKCLYTNSHDSNFSEKGWLYTKKYSIRCILPVFCHLLNFLPLTLISALFAPIAFLPFVVALLIIINTRSLINVTERNHFAETLTQLDHDILLITETWLTLLFSKRELFLTNLQIYRAERMVSVNCVSRHGGVLLGVKTGVPHTEVPRDTLPPSFRSSLVLVEFFGSAKYLIAVLYDPAKTVNIVPLVTTFGFFWFSVNFYESQTCADRWLHSAKS